MDESLIPSGTVLISSLTPYVHVLKWSCESKLCSYCLLSSVQLKRCLKCRLVYYCDKNCQRSDWFNHRYECGFICHLDFDLFRLYLRLFLRTTFKDNFYDELKLRQFYDCMTHMNDIQNDQQRLKQFYLLIEQLKLCLSTHDLPSSLPLLSQEPLQSNIESNDDEFYFKTNYNRSINDLYLLYCRLLINTFTITDSIDLKPIGCGFYLSATVYNHSCYPNCQQIFNGFRLQIRTIENIKENKEEYTINYCDLLQDRCKRQTELMKNYYFMCQCKRCGTSNDNSIINDKDILLHCSMCSSSAYFIDKQHLKCLNKKLQQHITETNLYPIVEKYLNNKEKNIEEFEKLFHRQSITMVQLYEYSMDKYIEDELFDKALVYSEYLLKLYKNLLPKYHSYASLNILKHMKLKLFLFNDIKEIQSMLNLIDETCQHIEIAFGKQHPLMIETHKLVEQFKLELNFR
ncbi:unnamed protein product [Didymodactylos carnosus]|uniref:Uncharacterized protein n=1 Tax=Didymodactylos carnosus TaxID=1234261 RepID=A0A813VSN1_9BILA|nr:unnamed protein product [Didymodactylos carnosus]CAF0844482.1 unnamed protein product [Didymodactylos carnosus]CAF3525423.1 unnamed protein product [Didymodactylos carnosus]CAF3631930.1 unnamed protein product [Didymodactylos carnosus]